jgi:hypothetical protein
MLCVKIGHLRLQCYGRTCLWREQTCLVLITLQSHILTYQSLIADCFPSDCKIVLRGITLLSVCKAGIFKSNYQAFTFSSWKCMYINLPITLSAFRIMIIVNWIASPSSRKWKVYLNFEKFQLHEAIGFLVLRIIERTLFYRLTSSSIYNSNRANKLQPLPITTSSQASTASMHRASHPSKWAIII